jgi:excinuclease ABC subunit C
MTVSPLSKYNIGPLQKDLLQELSGQRLFVKSGEGVTSHPDIVKSLQNQAVKNAVEYLERKRRGHALSIHEENNLQSALRDLQRLLSLDAFPRKIECFDISHLSGTFVYGSMVTFIDGKPAKKYYRLFKTKERNDDFANLAEVLGRRFARALQTDTSPGVLGAWQLPQLIIIDGGKGQLSSVHKIYEQYIPQFLAVGKSFDVQLCALAKGEERLFLPVDSSEPDERSSEGILCSGFTKFLIQRIRDETHRFGITNNRNARLRTIRHSELDTIPGVGQVTKQKLLMTFGSVAQVANALWDTPLQVQDLVGESTYKKLKKHFGISSR